MRDVLPKGLPLFSRLSYTHAQPGSTKFIWNEHNAQEVRRKCDGGWGGTERERMKDGFNQNTTCLCRKSPIKIIAYRNRLRKIL